MSLGTNNNTEFRQMAKNVPPVGLGPGHWEAECEGGCVICHRMSPPPMLGVWVGENKKLQQKWLALSSSLGGSLPHFLDKKRIYWTSVGRPHN